MANPMRFRISMASIMVLVVAAAAASALFAKIVKIISDAFGEYKYDAGAVVIIAIALTAIALGTLRNHSGVQMMIQAAGTYLGFLSLLWIIDGEHMRAVFYWFQASFAGMIVFPLLARRFAGVEPEAGAEPGWLGRVLETLPLIFCNIVLVTIGQFFYCLMILYFYEMF